MCLGTMHERQRRSHRNRECTLNHQIELALFHVAGRPFVVLHNVILDHNLGRVVVKVKGTVGDGDRLTSTERVVEAQLLTSAITSPENPATGSPLNTPSQPNQPPNPSLQLWLFPPTPSWNRLFNETGMWFKKRISPSWLSSKRVKRETV